MKAVLAYLLVGSHWLFLPKRRQVQNTTATTPFKSRAAHSWNLLLLAMCACVGYGATPTQDAAGILRAFLETRPNLEHVQFWVKHTTNRINDEGIAAYYKLYDCSWSPDAFVLRYYQKTNQNEMVFDTPAFVHIRIGPDFWSVMPETVVGWRDTGSTEEEPQHTLRESRQSDEELINLVYNMGLSNQRLADVRWRGGSFFAMLPSGRIEAEFALSESGQPLFAMVTNYVGSIKQIEKIQYAYAGGSPTEGLPNSFAIFCPGGDAWVKLSELHITRLHTTSKSIDPSKFNMSSLLASGYINSTNTVWGRFTNNAYIFTNLGGVVTEVHLPPRRTSGAGQPPGRASAVGIRLLLVGITWAGTGFLWLHFWQNRKQQPRKDTYE